MRSKSAAVVQNRWTKESRAEQIGGDHVSAGTLNSEERAFSLKTFQFEFTE
jgi:hypothetical protein